MKYNRDQSIKETLKWEGGYSNDAADPGGPTNYGITIADVRRYVKPGATAQDVKNLTQAQAIDIYANKYWKTSFYDCDNLKAGVDLSVFDFGVNSGPSRAKQYLDKAIGGTDEETIKKLNDARLAFLKRLKTWPNFGKGWGTRVAGIKAKSLEMNKAKPPVTGPVKPSSGSAALGTLAAVLAFITGHKALIIVAGALILVGGIYYYLENRKSQK